MHKDTPPSSPDMNQMDHMNDDMVYIGDLDEVIETYETDDVIEDEGMDEEGQEGDDAVCVFNGHNLASVFCGTLSKNGKIAVTGSEEDKAYVWDTTSGEIILDCTGHKDSVIFAELNSDETYLATADMSGTIELWRMSDKTLIWDYNMGDAIWLRWHMAASILFAGSVDGEVYMWKIPGGECKVLQGYGCRAEIGTLLPDGKRIAVGYEDGAIRVIDLKTNSVLATIPSKQGHSATITALDCHLDNNLMISAAVDGKTILSTSHGKIVSVLQTLNIGKENNTASTDQEVGSSMEVGDSNWVETVAFCKDPGFQVAATGTLSGDIFIWDISKQVLRQQMDQQNGISKLLWKGITSILFAAGLDGVLRCFDAKKGSCLRSFIGHTADILDLCISEDGTRALTTSDDSTARVFDISCVP